MNRTETQVKSQCDLKKCVWNEWNEIQSLRAFPLYISAKFKLQDIDEICSKLSPVHSIDFQSELTKQIIKPNQYHHELFEHTWKVLISDNCFKHYSSMQYNFNRCNYEFCKS